MSLAEILPLPTESQGISVWILGTVLLASIAGVTGMGKHFLKREEKTREETVAREMAMLARITAYDDFQRTGMSSLANSLATLNERTISVIQQSIISQREMTETIRDLTATIQAFNLERTHK